MLDESTKIVEPNSTCRAAWTAIARSLAKAQRPKRDQAFAHKPVEAPMDRDRRDRHDTGKVTDGGTAALTEEPPELPRRRSGGTDQRSGLAPVRCVTQALPN